MKKSLFEFDDYKDYLRAYIKSRPASGHGFKSSMAKAMNCQTAYVSQVLNANAQLSLEQAEELNKLFGHSESESEFFLLLVQENKAGTQTLRSRLKAQIKKILEKRHVLKDRFDIKKSLSPSDQMIYYSSWLYASIHILITISEYNEKEKIAEKFNLPLERVGKILDFLTETGLILKKGNHYSPGETKVFLGIDSPMLSKHLSNWRIKAIEALDKTIGKDLHLSSIYSLSRKDVTLIKEKLIKTVEESRQIIYASKEEELYCLNLDFFGV